MENLEAQISQVDILKTKCKKLFQEKSLVEEELSKQQKLVAKGIQIQGELKALKEEKKASEIILESTKKEKKAVEAKLQSLESQILILKQLKEEGDRSLRLDRDKIQELENRLRECNTSVIDSECSLKVFQENISKVEEEKQFLEETASKVRKEYEALELEVKTLREELSLKSLKNAYLEQQIEGWEAQKPKQSAICATDVEDLKARLVEVEDVKHQKDNELQKLGEERANIERSTNDEIEKVKFEEDLLAQEKKQIKCTLEQSHEDQVNLRTQLITVEENLKESDRCNRDLLEKLKNIEREKGGLIEKLKEKETGNEKLITQLKQRESEHSEFVESKIRMEELSAYVEKINLEMQQLTEEKIKSLGKHEDLEKEVFNLKENFNVIHKEKVELDIEFSKSVVELEKYENIVAEEKEKSDQLRIYIEDLKLKNTELTTRVEQLQKETENMETVLDGLKNTEIDITALCRKIYPILSKTVLPDNQKKDVLASVKGIKKLLTEANTRKENFKCEEDVQCLISVLSQMQAQSRNLIHTKDNKTWDSFSSSFDDIIKSLMTFYTHTTLVLDVEENVHLGEKCRETSLLFANFCGNLKDEEVRLSQVTVMMEGLRTEKNKLENEFAEAVKENKIINEKLESSSDQIDMIIKEKDEQLENKKKIITEYENYQIQLSQSFEKEKLQIESDLADSKERISALEEQLSTVENRKIELENILSGDSQREEVLNDLRQQLKTVLEEKEAMAHKYREYCAENVNLEKAIKRQTEDLQNLHTEREALVSEKIILQKEIENLKNIVEDTVRQKDANEKSWLDQKQDLEKKLIKESEEKHMFEKECGSITASKKSVEEKLVKEKELLGEKLNSLIKEQEIQMKETEDLRAENVLLQEKIQELQEKIKQLNDQVQQFHNSMKVTEEEIEVGSLLSLLERFYISNRSYFGITLKT